jgi:hypothetical protein
MKIYHYHPNSGNYLGHSIADQSPLEENIYLIPAYATSLPPLAAGEGEQNKFDGTAWQVVPIPSPEPPTEQTLVEIALNKRTELLMKATHAIAPLQDAVDIETATQTEIDLLKKWKAYRVALNRVVEQNDYPHEIVWPTMPNETIKK